MGYKRKLFNDKTIVAAAAVGVLAVSAIVGGVMLGTAGDDNKAIVDLDEGSNNNTKTENESDRVVSDDKNIIAENVENKTPDDKTSDNNSADKNISDAGDKTQGTNVSDNSKDKNEVNDSSNWEADDLWKNQPGEDYDGDIKDANVGNGILGLNFSKDSTLIWPVEGNIIIDYDMENTVYFATLDLYKCSDAVCVQSSVGTPVYAGSPCSVESIEYDSEIGNNVTVSLGNGYMLTYGQLKDVQVESGDVISEGDLIGYVGSPTKYYTVEGSHLYMKMTHDGQAVDPLDYLNYDNE